MRESEDLILDLSGLGLSDFDDEDETSPYSLRDQIRRVASRRNTTIDFAGVRFLHLNNNRLTRLPRGILVAFPRIQESFFFSSLLQGRRACVDWEALFTYKLDRYLISERGE